MMNPTRIPKKNIIRAAVDINFTDHVRRYVNTEGILIRDSERWIQYILYLSFKDNENRVIDVGEFLFTGFSNPVDKKAMLATARKIVRASDERYDCPRQTSVGYVPVFLDRHSTGTVLHECFTHLLSSHYMLGQVDDVSVTFNELNFGQVVAPKELSIIANPRLGTTWGDNLYTHDFEGVPARKTPLIIDGKVVGSIADRHGRTALDNILTEDQRKIAKILPGHSRMEIVFENDCEGDMEAHADVRGCHIPSPRLSVFDIRWSNPISNRELYSKFLDEIRKSKHKYGIRIEGGGGEIRISEGVLSVYPEIAYRVDQNGDEEPTKLFMLNMNPLAVLQNIQGISNSRMFVPDLCGGESGEILGGEIVGCGLIRRASISYLDTEKLTARPMPNNFD